MKQGLKYVAWLVGIYLGVAYFDGSTKLVGAGGNAFSTGVKTLQGR